MWIKYAVALSLVTGAWACKSSEKPAAAPPSTGSGSATGAAGSATGAAGSAKDPWVAPDASLVPETAESKKKRADAAIARVAAIMPKLAKVRELTFDHDIPREYQSAANFKAFVHAEIVKEMPKDKAADESAALFHIGLLAKPGNLAELEEQAFTTQAGAYYDPATKRFFMVMVPDSDMMLDTMSAHELTHGLQDQHFDLQKFMPSDDASQKALDDDHQAARRFVVEGDATFTMFLYQVVQMTNKKVDGGVVKMLNSQLDQFASMTPEEMMKQNSAGFGASMDPDIKKSVDAMGEIPLTVLVPMIDSYMQGAKLTATAFEHGGWKGVNALYTAPPESTEQALHPATKMYPNRDRPLKVTIPAAKDGAQVADIVFGELQWQIYFELWAKDQKVIASEGWGGDRTVVTKRADGRMVARTVTAWDTAKDATEFQAAYKASMTKRFAKGSGDPFAATGFDRGDGAGKIFGKLDRTKVIIVDGADDATALAALATSATVK